jgi:hypothetical protein
MKRRNLENTPASQSTFNAAEHIGTDTGHGSLWPILPGLLQIHYGIPITTVPFCLLQ